MVNICPLCKLRVSDWMMASEKAKEVGTDIVHKSCMIDYSLRTGRDYEEERKVDSSSSSTS